ncbi:hypothetical protein [Actinokineospora globicatena]|uniref:hypothetical protein n=1 Tax=Actinokineospora globicatena TaxID=103729 RepID=UPI002553D89C|nr:hypothetical protein [Actinokineospora globicatena]
MRRRSAVSTAGPTPLPGAGQRGPGLLALQRSAGNSAVSSLLGSPQPHRVEPPLDVPVAIPDAGLPGEIVGEAERQRVVVHEAAERAGERVDQSVRAHQDRLAATAATQEATAQGALSALRANVSTQAAGRAAAIQATSAGTRAALRAQAQGSRVDSMARIDAMGEESRAAGQREADRASRETPTADAARPAAVAGDPDIAAGQDRIGQAVAGKASTELARSSGEAVGQVRAGVTAAQSSLYDPAKASAAEQVTAAADQTDRALAEGTATATGAMRATSTRTVESATRGHQRFVTALRAGRQTAEGDLTAWAAGSRIRLRDTAVQLGAGLVDHARSLAAMVAARSKPVGDPLGAVRAAGDQVVGGIEDAAAGLDEGAGQLASGHQQAVGGVGEQAAGAFGRVEEAAGTALRQGAAAFAGQAGQTRDTVGAELDRAPSVAADALAAQHRSSVDGLTGTVDRSVAAQQGWVSDARSHGASGATRFASEADRLSAQARDEQPVQRWLAEIVGRMRNWLREKCGDVLGGILSGLILSIPTIIIGVGLLLAGPVGWTVLAGLLVVGVGLGIYGRWQEYKADHGGEGPGFLEGLGLVGLGIADLTGIPYIVEACVGQRAFAPTGMSEFERWERGTQGVVNLALLIAGGAKKLFAERAPVDPVRAPVDPHTVPIPGEGNNARFEAARQVILDTPPADRAAATRVLFARLTELSGNTWNFRANPTRGGGVHFTGEGAPFIFAVDAAGNVYQGKIGPGTLTIHPDGTTTVDYGTLRPLNPTPPPTPPPAPATNPIPPVAPHLPPPSHEPEPVP